MQFDALHMLGVIAAQTNAYPRAVELIGKAIESSPDNAVAHNNLGNALADLKQQDAAVASYDKAIALKPDYAMAWSNLSLLYIQTEDWINAYHAMEKAHTVREQATCE